MEVGLRISYMKHIGTVRFSGPVEQTSGTWLGIEWDDPKRGKHDGSKDGKQYFECLVSGAGSFIRLSQNIYFGNTFLEALRSKYIEPFHGSKSQEVVILGSSQGAVQVEAVNLDKVRNKLARLSSLREVSLEGVAKADPQGMIGATCPNVRGLDLSKSLIHSWTNIAAIAQELPHLQRLYLSQNRFQRYLDPKLSSNCFNSLIELRLNNTLMTWQNILRTIMNMPALQELECGYNRFTEACFYSDDHVNLTTPVHTLNLDNNQIGGWRNVYLSFLDFPSLARVILANNQIENIPFPMPRDKLLQLKQLSLSFNCLESWCNIHALAAWAPSLESLTLSGNPIMDHSQNARPLIIARLATLQVLDGASISEKERRNAELYYLSCIVNQGSMPDHQQTQEHSRWQDLCLKYGKPDTTLAKAASDTLKNRLMELRIYRTSESNVLNEDTAQVIRALPSMTLKMLRGRIRKVLAATSEDNIKILMVMHDHSFVTLTEDLDDRTLSWVGLESGSQLLCMVS
ncbi:hypothetical protein Ac2012v2_001938 [Leucoagaricus gongylophorus]